MTISLLRESSTDYVEKERTHLKTIYYLCLYSVISINI